MNESRREREKELFFFFFLLLPFLRLSIEDLGVVVGFWFQPKKKKKKGRSLEGAATGHWLSDHRRENLPFFFLSKKKKKESTSKERKTGNKNIWKKKWPPCRSGRSAAIGRPRWLIENERFIQSFITHTANQLGSAFKGQLVDGVGVTGPPAFHQRPTGDDE